jgi:hypothetical protein
MTRGGLSRRKYAIFQPLGCRVRGRYRDFCQSDFFIGQIATMHDARAAAQVLGLALRVLTADNEREIDAAFASFASVRKRGKLFASLGEERVDIDEQRRATRSRRSLRCGNSRRRAA